MNAVNLAEYIINKSLPTGISNLKLQKTMYACTLDYYKYFNKDLLIDDFEAWQYGPVIPEVYWKYRGYGAEPIRHAPRTYFIELLPHEKDIIDERIWACVNKQPWELVNESHRPDGAWKKTIDMGLPIISKKLIHQEARL